MRNRRGPRPAGEPRARERALPLAVRATTAASPERAAAGRRRRRKAASAARRNIIFTLTIDFISAIEQPCR
jgi:hypothetical protein